MFVKLRNDRYYSERYEIFTITNISRKDDMLKN